MQPIESLLQANPVGTLLTFAVLLLLLATTVLPIICGLLYGAYFLLTLPMRRSERARQFLELLELGLKDGQTAERAIVSAARSSDAALGKPFHRVAEYLESGQKLSVALELVPRLLPRPLVATLRTGEKLGNVAQVIPACRQMLGDGLSQVSSALNYLIVLCFCVTPFMISVPLVMRIKVLPQFTATFEGLGVTTPLPGFSKLVFGLGGWFTLISTLTLLFVWLVMVFYVGGPRLRRGIDAVVPGLSDALSFRLPWRRRRLQRDFSAMLAVLLDVAVPEAEAVRLAAECTDNRVLIRRSERVRVRLAEGVTLPEALKALDDDGELHWRLTNARHGQGGFRRALAGWHEALDARAFQQEQTAAQFATTSLVLFNGVMVASFVFAIYLAIIGLIQQATLW